MSGLSYRFFPESNFGNFSHVDGTIAFYLRAQSLVSQDSVVLDLGCGHGEVSEDTVEIRRQIRSFKGKVKRVIGLDVDSVGIEKPLLDEFRRITDENRWPLGSGEVDMCICDYVLEHIQRSNDFIKDFLRLLRPGNYFCARTSNAWGYVRLVSRLTPNRFHAAIAGAAQDGRRDRGVFPTVYKCNSLQSLRSILRRHGFRYCVQGSEAESNCLTSSTVLYGLRVFFQRTASGFLRNGLVVFAQKPMWGET